MFSCCSIKKDDVDDPSLHKTLKKPVPVIILPLPRKESNFDKSPRTIFTSSDESSQQVSPRQLSPRQFSPANSPRDIVRSYNTLMFRNRLLGETLTDESIIPDNFCDTNFPLRFSFPYLPDPLPYLQTEFLTSSSCAFAGAYILRSAFQYDGESFTERPPFIPSLLFIQWREHFTQFVRR